MSNATFTIGEEQPPMWAESILVARVHSCEAHLAVLGRELNIQFIASEEEGKGHATAMIGHLRRYAAQRGLTLVSSLPINAAWIHLCEKHAIPCYVDVRLPGAVLLNDPFLTAA